MPAKRKVLITGSSGMLGIDLCQELAEDYDIYGVDNRSRAGFPAVSQRPLAGSRPCDFRGRGNLPYNSTLVTHRFVKCDITNENETLSVLSKIKPDIVVHAAAWTDVDGCELDADKAYGINSEGTENVALACEENSSILLYLSTDFVFDGKKKTAYKETDKANPISIYGDSKFVGEETIQRIWPKHFIIRTSWLYGMHGKNFVDTIIGKAKAESELKVVDDQVGSPTYTRDLSKAIHKLLGRIFTQYAIRNTQYGTYHVSNSGSTSWYEYAKAILKMAGPDTKVTPIPSEELSRPAKRPAMSVLDNSKFEKFTGHKMRNWKTALKEYLSVGHI